MKLVLDTNVLISGVISDGATRELLVGSEHTYLSPDFLREELDKYSDLLLEKSGLAESELDILMSLLMEDVEVLPYERYGGRIDEAKALLADIDPKDAPFFAVALSEGCPIWSDDAELKEQEKVEVVGTSQLLKRL